ncbi:MAG TPA: hypothetical protein VK527_03545 [Candidatus Limnocylindrales bacterium]|nr:hypothetical protein [Candidatus Limnocylindrales bacterium]
MSPARAVALLATAAALLLASGTAGASDGADPSAVDHATWVDHDAKPIKKPKEREINLYSYMFRQAISDPLSHAFDIPDKLLWLASPFGVDRKRHDANANAFDEVPNSTWFTNRNHIKHVAPELIRTGPYDGVRPAKPWTVTGLKKGGFNLGFQMKDAEGRKWIVKLDRKGHPQSGSGAATVSSRLAWAAGYNISLDQAMSFLHGDLKFETKPPKPGDDPPVTDAQIQDILKLVAQSSDGRYYGSASLFLPGKPVGPIDLHGRRKDDPNDWFKHKNRRELRGLFVFYSWLNNWDVKDQQSLDMYGKPGDYLTHYQLDVDGSLGAAAEGAKPLPYGFENRVDFGWTATRMITLGFVNEPWRKAHQETGIPSVGNFSAEFNPKDWRPLEEVPPFRKMMQRDAYWGAKLVASFSDEQIAAAIDAVGYEDPRARDYLLRTLIERRDRVARYWFGRVAPLDFFHVEDGVLRFHDLAVDRGYTGSREYEVEVDSSDDGNARAPGHLRLRTTEIALGDRGGSKLWLTLSVSGSDAKSVRVELTRKGSDWVVTRVRHA